MTENFFPTCPQLYLYDKSLREELTSTTLTLISTTLNPARCDPQHGDAPGTTLTSHGDATSTTLALFTTPLG